MNINRFISNIKNLREAAPTNSVANGGVQNFDKFLFPRDEDLLSQDYQTPAEVGDSRDDFLGVYPVMKLQLDKSSDGPSIDSMVDASKEYFNKVTGPGADAPLYSPIENIRNIVRGLKEEMVGGAPTNNVGGGHIAGAVPGEAPPVFKKKRNPTPVGRYGSRRMWLQDLKKNGK